MYAGYFFLFIFLHSFLNGDTQKTDVHINSRIFIHIKTKPKATLKYDKCSMISRIRLRIFKTCSHSTKRDKRWLTQPVNTAFTDIFGKRRSPIINSVYCSDVLEFNEMTEMTFCGEWQSSCWPFPVSSKQNIWIGVSDHFAIALSNLQYLFSYNGCIWVRLMHNIIVRKYFCH